MPRSLALAALLAAAPFTEGACAGSPPGAEAPVSTGAPATAPAAPAPAASAPADGGGAPDCVAACVQRNQMRAVAFEQIEADCRAECGPK